MRGITASQGLVLCLARKLRYATPAQRDFLENRHMSESEKSDNRFWRIFVTLMIAFGTISIISRNYEVEWYYTWGAAALTAILVVFVFRKLSS